MTASRTKVEQQDVNRHILPGAQSDNSLPFSYLTKNKRYQGSQSSTSWTSSPSSSLAHSRPANTSELVARCVRLTAIRVRHRGNPHRMREETAEGRERQQMRSQALRSHTSYAAGRQHTHKPTSHRPATASGCTQLPTQTFLLTHQTSTEQTRPVSNTSKEKWNSSTRVDKPTSALSMATTGGVITSPSTNNKAFRTLSSVAAEILSVRKLSQNGGDNDMPEVKVSQNKAVEAAFERAISHKTVNNERLRVGLITNDITPRVYLQESKGSKQFKKMNFKLRDQLTDVYNYRRFQTSLPSSLNSDTYSSDGQSSDDQT